MGWPKGVPRKASTENSPFQATPVSQSQMSSIPSDGTMIANEKVVQRAVQVDTLGEEGISEKLFPDFREPQEEPQQEAIAPQETQPQEEPENLPIKGEENKDAKQDEIQTVEQTQTPESPKVIDLDQMGDYVVVQSINGVKREIKLRDLNRMDQTDAAITQKAQRVAEERRQLEAIRQELKRQLQNEPSKREEQTPISNRQVAQQEADRIAYLEQEIQTLHQSLSPVVYQANRQSLASELKNIGFDDFLEYIPKIEQHVASVEDDKLFNYYNTPEGAKALYFQLKAKELKESAIRKPDAPRPPVVAQKPKPPVMRVGAGDQGSSGITDDWKTRYSAAMKYAKDNPGNKEAWNELLRMKGFNV